MSRSAVLRDYPLRLWAEQSEYLESLLREFHLLLLSSQRDDVARGAPGRLVQLAGVLQDRFGGLLQTVNDERQAALDRGLDRIDSVLPLTDGLPQVLDEVRRVLEETDEFCRNGDLLSLPRSPLLIAFATWAGTELVAQSEGAEPTPWRGPF
jgi:hypothetical protein